MHADQDVNVRPASSRHRCLYCSLYDVAHTAKKRQTKENLQLLQQVRNWAENEERTHHHKLLIGDLVYQVRSYAEFGLFCGTAIFCAAFLAPLRVRQPRKSMPTEKMPSRTPVHNTEHFFSTVQTSGKHGLQIPDTHAVLHGLL